MTPWRRRTRTRNRRGHATTGCPTAPCPTTRCSATRDDAVVARAATAAPRHLRRTVTARLRRPPRVQWRPAIHARSQAGRWSDRHCLVDRLGRCAAARWRRRSERSAARRVRTGHGGDQRPRGSSPRRSDRFATIDRGGGSTRTWSRSSLTCPRVPPESSSKFPRYRPHSSSANRCGGRSARSPCPRHSPRSRRPSWSRSRRMAS